MEDKTLWSCGDNWFKQLGLGSSIPYTYFLKQVKGESGVGFLQNIATFDAGWLHSLAADVNGFVYAWGTDNYGQLGNGPGYDPCEFPTKVLGVGGFGYLSDIVYVSAGRSGTHSLAVNSAGYVYAWGNNDSGQCGNQGNGQPEQIPVRVLDDDPQTSGVYLGDIAHIIRADAGMHHSIALDNEGYVWHWGSGSTSGTYPEKVKKSGGPDFLSNIVQISSCYYSIAVDNSRNVWEWNDSRHAYKVRGGEMGTTYLENIVEVREGGGYSGRSIARTSDGQVLKWDFGGSPVYVTDGEMNTPSGLLEGIISIDSGCEDHKLAVDSNGYGWAWGMSNEYGQFGVGNNYPWPEPKRMICTCAQPGSEIIYVNEHATGDRNGTSWENAYTDLQDALGYARAGCGSQIWVAAGTYKPTNCPGYSGVSFELVDGVSLYGHFAGVETSTSERDLANANYETILDGLIDPNNDGRVDYIIKGQSIDNVTIDGFTVQSAGSDGINLDDCNAIISNCMIRDNYVCGIANENGSGMIIHKCTFTDNEYGVYNYNEALTINGSIIKNNSWCGIMLDTGSSATIINNWIYNNEISGIYISYPASVPTIRNNTICNNYPYGIEFYGYADANIRNCIIRGNTEGDLGGGTFNNVNYCCLQSYHSGTGNIYGDANDPCFVNPPDNLHIKKNSPCRNKGNSNGIPSGETDIDGEGRINGIVDIGADEYYRSPDFDKNGIVNFKDFALLAKVWEADSPTYNLADGTIIDNKDLVAFCNDWLTQPGGGSGWMFESQGGQMMMAGDGSMLESSSEQQMMMDSNTPMVYLVYDGNMTPDPNTEVTVEVHTDTPLFVLDVYAKVAGDANITTAMGSYDCTDYGWDPGWNWNPYIDEPNGIVEFGGISWTAVANGTVGYFKFIYHSGKVSVSFDQECSIAFGYGSSCPSVPFSTDALLIGRDPNE
jgi:parallel beta-helix repeat protein